jgi:hypothetical protein
MDSSPFASRLNSNSVATNSEIQTLLELPTSCPEKQELRNEQSALLSISKHRVLISPIRKLPLEILQEIFIACLPSANNPVMSSLEPPILLTQICSFWRNVAHTTPQLWKSIHIVIPGRENSSSTAVENWQRIDRRSEAVQEWLTRSAAYPLEISIGANVDNSLNEFYYKIIDSLIRFSKRWREFCFVAPYQALLPIASLSPSKVPLLETLSLNCQLHGLPPIDFTLLDPQSVCGVLKAPNLRDLRFYGTWLTVLNKDVSRLPINWGQLTTIVLERDTWDECCLTVLQTYKLLSLCRNLITCQLEIGSISDLETNTALVSLPFLTRLSVHESSSLSKLFTLLHLPSLNDIEFHTTIRPTQQSSTSLLSLLTRFHNTTKLITDSHYFTRLEFIKCLRLCPLLKSLSIRKPNEFGVTPNSISCKVDDAFLRLFFESSNDEGALCPHLEIFESPSWTKFSETALLQFVGEKNGGSTTGLAKLKRLYVRFSHRPLHDINQELEPYKQAGLVISIIYPLRVSHGAP